MSGEITHQGVVDKIENGHIRVRIVQSSACSSCQMSGHCNASDSKVKDVDIYTSDNTNLNVGDEVTVIATSRAATIAVVLSAVIPLFIIIAVLAAVLIATKNEVAASLSAIASLIPYYIILYIFRDKIGQSVSFRLG